MGYYPQESLYKPYKYHGYTVRGTPNCPLKPEPLFRSRSRFTAHLQTIKGVREEHGVLLTVKTFQSCNWRKETTNQFVAWDPGYLQKNDLNDLDQWLANWL